MQAEAAKEMTIDLVIGELQTRGVSADQARRTVQQLYGAEEGIDLPIMPSISPEAIETFREILSGMLDMYLSSISNRMNSVMKVLTIIATIFIPLTFIAGIYGMNFENMPELHWSMGYPFALILMGVIGIAMLFYFKRKAWL